MTSDAGHRPRVTLLWDETWPDQPGVCCWRSSLRAAFGSLDADMREHGLVPGAALDPPKRDRGTTPPARRGVRRAVSRGRHLASRYALSVGRAVDHRLARRSYPALRAALDGSTVIAESVGVAQLAVEADVPRRSIWVLALPADLRTSINDGAAMQWVSLAPDIAGFLTDSEPARATIERATSMHRTRVELFPPLAFDVPCPICGGSTHDGENRSADPAVALLARWRSALTHGRPDESTTSADLRMYDADIRVRDDARTGWGEQRDVSTWFVAPAGNPRNWTSEQQRERARAILGRYSNDMSSTARPRRSVVISGFDLKFARELGARLGDRADLTVTLDEWRGLMTKSSQTSALTVKADTVVAEWARPSAAWLARRKRASQLLIVRLHRYELDFPYPRQIDIDQVDAVVCVSPPVGRRIEAELGWPAEKLVYIPNHLDFAWLGRTKLPEARFAIGVVGIEWANKRFDLALDVLAAVRRHDRRFKLYVRSKAPWDSPYAWARPDEREYVTWCMERIEHDPDLHGAVTFDQPGQDMARWYRQVGHVLSMSDIESFHMAAAEGMASGAVPIIRPWPGAAEIYGAGWVHQNIDSAVTELLTNTDAERWSARADEAQARIDKIANPERVVAAWADLAHGEIASARSHFAETA